MPRCSRRRTDSRTSRDGTARSASAWRLGRCAPRHEVVLYQVGDGLVRVEAGENVRAAVDGRRGTLRHGALLEPPRAIADDARIGVDVAGEPELAAQQVGHDLLRERKAGRAVGHALIGDANRHAVVRHDRRHAGVDRGLERLEVVLEASAWIDLPLAERIVGIEPELLRTAARKVLERQRHGGRRAHRAALQPQDQRLHDLRIEVGVFGERLLNAVPAGLGRQVGRVAVHATQPDGAPFAGS